MILCFQRPGRMCCFCEKIITGGKLKRHFITHRHTHEEVANILLKPKNEQNKLFEHKRTEGMYLYNVAHLSYSKLMRERLPKTPDSLRMCLNCKRFFSNRTFYKHKEMCSNTCENTIASTYEHTKRLRICSRNSQ